MSKEFMPAEELLREQVSAVRELMAGAWQGAPGFARRLEAAGLAPGDLGDVCDLPRFPILRKAASGRHRAAALPVTSAAGAGGGHPIHGL